VGERAKEAIEIQLHPNNLKRDNGFMLNQAQYLLINLLQKGRRLPKNEVRLSNMATEQKLLTNHPSKGMGLETGPLEARGLTAAAEDNR
jgi:hypothetical protein